MADQVHHDTTLITISKSKLQDPLVQLLLLRLYGGKICNLNRLSGSDTVTGCNSDETS